MSGIKATVSIVVPTLNREESLRRFLEGALQQTYEDYEIVIVDQSDGEPSEGRVLVSILRSDMQCH